MADKKVTIKFGGDSKEADGAIKNVTKNLNDLAKKVEKHPITKLSKSVTALGHAFGFAKAAIGAVTSSINDMTDAYKTQAQAEKQLEAAAKNNPYLSDYSVQQLKDYASQLQSISTIGDEELLPMMAQLAAAGRTQNEIQEIMSTALNISASGAMSLDTAVKQLNATYSGTAGKLGQMSGAVKGLTTEQLKNGEAVKILKEQYSGIAKSVSDTTGGWQKFKNSFGDFKEVLGSGFANIQNTTGKILSTFFDTVTSKIKSAGKEADTFKKKLGIIATLDDETASVKDLEGTIEQIKSEIARLGDIEDALTGNTDRIKKAIIKDSNEIVETAKTEFAEFNRQYEEERTIIAKLQAEQQQLSQKALKCEISKEEREAINETLEADIIAHTESMKLLNAKITEYEKLNKARNKSAFNAEQAAEKEINALKEIGEKEFSSNILAVQRQRIKYTEELKNAQEKLAKAQAEANKSANASEEKKRNEDALKIITDSNKALNEQIEKINQKYELQQAEGQTVDELAWKQEILNAKEASYLALISENTSLVTKNNAVSKARLSDIKKGYEELATAAKDSDRLKELTKEAESLEAEAKKLVDSVEKVKLSDKIKAAISVMSEMKNSTAEGTEEWQKYIDKIRELKGLLEQVQAAEEKQGGNSAQSWAKAHEDKLKIASDFASKYAQIMQGLSDLVTQQAENEAAVKQAALEKQLAAGEISEEEYAEKKEEIEKEAAEKQYKIQMWEWSANLLDIQAQTALAIVNALANSGNPYVGIAMAAIMGTMGAIQLATAIANKPVPPSFATGGVVGGYVGARTGSDDTVAHVKTGEMILNARQQEKLWKSIENGRVGGQNAINLSVNNYASGKVVVRQRMTQDGLKIYIRETVKSQMEDGAFSRSQRIADLRERGNLYTN